MTSKSVIYPIYSQVPILQDCTVGDVNLAMKSLEERWWDLSNNLQVDGNHTQDWWNIIRGRYSEKQRYYHTLDHLTEMFRHYDEHAFRLKQPELVSLAIFFHDLIYDPTQKDNEEQSAREFVRFSHETSAKLTESDCSTVKEWILLTKNHTATTEGSDDYHYFLDIDMAVLGRPEKEYMNYAEQIKKEYSYIPDPEYKIGRTQVLTNFSRRGRLYSTKEFHEKLSVRAKENIMKEIDVLKQ